MRLKTYAMLKMNLFASVFNLLANLILLYFFRNIIVAAITTCLSYFIVFIYVYKIVNKDWPVDFQPLTIVKSVAASAFMVAIMFGISSSLDKVTSVSTLAGILIAGIVVYFGALFALRTFSDKELQFMKSCVCRQREV